MLNCTAKRLQEVRPNTLLIGVDIGKKQHACVVMDLGARVVTRFKFSNSRRGFERLLGKVKTLQDQVDAEHLLFGMEPTGHYWRNLAYFLDGRGYRFRLVNPFTLKSHREGQDLSRTKNDYRDAAMVAELLRTGKFTLTRLTYGPWADLRRTFALYSRLVDDRARQKNLLRGVLDCLFPEFTQVFSHRDPLGKRSPALDCSGCAPGLPCSPQDKREDSGEICISGPGGLPGSKVETPEAERAPSTRPGEHRYPGREPDPGLGAESDSAARRDVGSPDRRGRIPVDGATSGSGGERLSPLYQRGRSGHRGWDPG